MHCFLHQDRHAVGLCKHCSKGLCRECAVDLGHGLACKGVHEGTVESLNTLIVRNTRITNTNARAKLIMPLFFLSLGLIFVVTGYQQHGGDGYFAYTFGGVFIAFSVIFLFYNLKAWANPK